MKTAKPTFGSRLRALRHAAGLSQPQLAERAGVSLQGLRDLERGRRQPKFATAVALAKALGVGLEAFA